MSAAETSWVLQALLATLQGDPSVGLLNVASTGATGTLPKFSIAVPIVQGQMTWETAFEVAENQDTEDGEWPVTLAGVDVPIVSIQSGLRVNLAAGTICRWVPPIAGLAETAVIAAGGTTGGTLLEEFGALKQIRRYKDIGTRPQAQQLFLAQVHEYPAAVLTWMGCTPADGSSTPALGPRASRLGSGIGLFKQNWLVHLITSRLDATDPRTEEGDRLRDAVLELLIDRHAFRGHGFSHPVGIEVLSADMEAATPTSFIDAIRFTTTEALIRTELASDVDWHDWVQTRIVRQVPPIVPPQDPLEPALEFPDVTDPMPPNT